LRRSPTDSLVAAVESCAVSFGTVAKVDMVSSHQGSIHSIHPERFTV
jgi:hypothetical protein